MPITILTGSRLSSPLALGAVQLWLQPIDASTLFDATSGGSTPSIGAAVARIEDKSGNGYHATNATGSQQPSRDAKGLSLDGSNDRLQRTSNTDLLRNVSGATIYAVRKYNALPSGIQQIFSHSVNGTDARSLIGSDATGKSRCGARRLDSDTFQAIASSGNVSTSVYEIDTAVFNFSSASAQLYRGADLVANSNSFQTAGGTSNTVSQQFSLGSSQTGASQYFNGVISEVIVVHEAHSASKLRAMWDLLRRTHEL